MEISTEQYLERYTTSKSTARSQREELLTKFFDTIDEEREGTPYPPVNRKVYSIKLNQVFKSMWDLERFYAECKDYNGPFSKRFFGGFKEQSWKS